LDACLIMPSLFPSSSTIEVNGQTARIALSGYWDLAHGEALEQQIHDLFTRASGVRAAELDLAAIARLDTMGAHLVNSLRERLQGANIPAVLKGVREEQRLLLDEVTLRPGKATKKHSTSSFYGFLVDLGASVVAVGKDLRKGVGFLGSLIVGLGSALAHPRQFRGTSLVYQMEQVVFRSVPIIVLISFLVGAIVAQQGVFQMERFGAVLYVVDAIGVLVLRELAVLLTSIMIAGRSGSAFTAEIGSMKMREEIDALRTMGLDPMAVLIVPRMLALIIGMPLLTFISAMAAIGGGGLVIMTYGGISPDAFFNRLQNVIGLNTFLVGLIKAPFMALVIGLIASMEGMAVAGSAESLGRQTTASVVKAIFMVIVVDGLFAMFFASIRY
jgi:phospholipid/cholesterol/gamma-HCH transport system permease protein